MKDGRRRKLVLEEYDFASTKGLGDLWMMVEGWKKEETGTGEASPLPSPSSSAPGTHFLQPAYISSSLASPDN
ncbi:hypothetical protein Pmani_012418 [Petrolisthes manimaculis]|uniref:Uncharacterized protein n=1 Tax=Petrolisthes manimaculis TaxID=1843537 RepID=A0AAE1Q0H0_9EUCA|nr:hypothetical protein Pmani_012418 [Petrolisthes manimaculis]